VVRSRRLPQPPTFGLHEDFLGNVHNVVGRLARGGYDVAHAFHLADAWAARWARRLGAPPFVFSFHGMPTREHLVARRYRLEMIQAVASSAAVTAVLSEAAATPFRRYLLREPRILPGGVVGDSFSVDAERAPAPTIFCAASVGDPRKQGALLVEGFRLLRKRRPDARLRVVRTRDPLLSPESIVLPEGGEWVEAEATADLAREYAGAWASVLPSVDEPFGLVLVESLAAGTPVVAARSGACPEIVSDERIGSLFEPGDAADLAAAMERALALGDEEGTAAACRERAAEFDWSRVVERYEDAYWDALGARVPG
jgi:glycosyltransferase involved in cell wall biosynthesis